MPPCGSVKNLIIVSARNSSFKIAFSIISSRYNSLSHTMVVSVVAYAMVVPVVAHTMVVLVVSHALSMVATDTMISFANLTHITPVGVAVGSYPNHRCRSV